MPVTYDFRKLSREDELAMRKYWAVMSSMQNIKFGDSEFVMPQFPPVPVPPGVSKEAVTINDVKGVRVFSKREARDGIIMYIHGGGYVWGSAEDGTIILFEAKKRFNIDSFSVDYTLAPKKQFPTQLNECLAFYKGLLAMGYKKIALLGESAGGNMCLTLTLKLKEDKIPLPAAVVCISGLIDYTFAGGIEINDFLAGGIGFMAEQYAGKQDLKNPLISPTYGDYNGFPPLLMQTGTLVPKQLIRIRYQKNTIL